MPLGRPYMEKKLRILFLSFPPFQLHLLPYSFRFILNVEECFSGRDYGFSREHNCSLLPFWFLVTNHCSHLLICINASLGFVVYCAMSKEFREAFNSPLASLISIWISVFQFARNY